MRSITLSIVVLFVLSLNEVASAAIHKESGKIALHTLILRIDPKLENHIKKDGWKMDTSDESDGFISINGPFEGSDRYFIFRGNPSDLVVRDVRDQSLKMKQDFAFFLVTKEKIQSRKIGDVFPQNEIKSAYKGGHQFISRSAKAKDWQDSVEWFDLPIHGNEIKLIISTEDPSFYDTDKDLQTIVGTLKWTGSKFRLTKTNALIFEKMGIGENRH